MIGQNCTIQISQFRIDLISDNTLCTLAHYTTSHTNIKYKLHITATISNLDLLLSASLAFPVQHFSVHVQCSLEKTE